MDGYPQAPLCDQEGGSQDGPTEVSGLCFLEPCVVGKGLARESYHLEDLERSLMADTEGH